jgi:predicted TIM-barrel fold metal-dependent hydrolase
MCRSPVVDTHVHWISPAFLAFLQTPEAQNSLSPDGSTPLSKVITPVHFSHYERMASLDVLLAQMDEAGVEFSLLSLVAPATAFGDAVLKSRLARDMNDEFLATALKRSDRFGVLISLPLPHVEESIKELERVAAHPCAQGVMALTVWSGWTMDDSSLEPVYQRAAELHLPIQTHPTTDVLPNAFDGFALDATLFAVVATSVNVARMILSGMLDRVPDLDLIVPHLGGTLPFLAQRFDDFGQGVAAHSFTHYLRDRLYYDTVSYHQPAFRCTVDTIGGTDRIMLGSDYPARGTVLRAVEDVRANITSADKLDAVLGRNASRWFKPGS